MAPSSPKIKESLFILWGFEGPSNQTIKTNIIELLNEIAIDDQPDFIIIPDRILVTTGSYRKLSVFGQENSSHRQRICEQNPGKRYEEIFVPYQFYNLGINTILTFIIWLTSWLKSAGNRNAPLEKYLLENDIFGEEF